MSEHELLKRWSYSSLSGFGAIAHLREAVWLLRMVHRGSEQRVTQVLRAFQETCRYTEATTGVQLKGKRILEIGAGQYLGTLRCFSLHNDVTGIDSDVVLQHLNYRELIAMIRANPTSRTIKTLVRKAMGYDARFKRALATAPTNEPHQARRH